MKLKWRVGEKPTGRYRSFYSRSWPTAEYPDGKMAVMLSSVEEGRIASSYEPRIAESTVLEVRVADYRDNTFIWRKLVARPLGVKAAKLLAQQFIYKYGEALRDPTRRI